MCARWLSPFPSFISCLIMTASRHATTAHLTFNLPHSILSDSQEHGLHSLPFSLPPPWTHAQTQHLYTMEKVPHRPYMVEQACFIFACVLTLSLQTSCLRLRWLKYCTVQSWIYVGALEAPKCLLYLPTWPIGMGLAWVQDIIPIPIPRHTHGPNPCRYWNLCQSLYLGGVNFSYIVVGGWTNYLTPLDQNHFPIWPLGFD